MIIRGDVEVANFKCRCQKTMILLTQSSVSGFRNHKFDLRTFTIGTTVTPSVLRPNNKKNWEVVSNDLALPGSGCWVHVYYLVGEGELSNREPARQVRVWEVTIDRFYVWILRRHIVWLELNICYHCIVIIAVLNYTMRAPCHVQSKGQTLFTEYENSTNIELLCSASWHHFN